MYVGNIGNNGNIILGISVCPRIHQFLNIVSLLEVAKIMISLTILKKLTLLLGVCNLAMFNILFRVI